MADDSYFFGLFKNLENRVTQFEETLRQFGESFTVFQEKAKLSAGATSVSLHPLTVESPGGRIRWPNTFLPHLPSLQPLLSNLAHLRKELVGLQQQQHDHQFQLYHHAHQRSGSVAGASSALASRGPITATSASFLVALESALTACDTDFPGRLTAPPPHPSLYSIRQSPEACWSVWNEFYHTRHQPLPIESLSRLRQPTFDNWSYTDVQLLRFARYFFTGDATSTGDASAAETDAPEDARLRLVWLCGIPEEKLDAWLCTVYAKYNCVAFHNFKHAFMVLQMMYASIWCADLASLFCHRDLFTLLFAAICHDLDHPGLTNTYQNNAQSSLSICYNTLSPLENHHCAVAFELVRTPATNIFVNFSYEDFDAIRQNTVRCILGTDMSKHADILEAFTAKMLEHSAEGTEVAPPTADLNGIGPTTSQLKAVFDEDNESQILTMVVLLKMCDISTEIRPDEVAQPWLRGLICELNNQNDIERKANLPLSPIMDESNLLDCQINFLSYVMLPLAKSLTSVIPALKSSFLIPTEKQLTHYHRLAAATTLRAEAATTTARRAEECQHGYLFDGSDEFPLVKSVAGAENEKFNGSFSTSPSLSILAPATPVLQRSCISSSNPDSDSQGFEHCYSHSHMCTPCCVSCSGSQHCKRTSIVSSAGLIATELTPPHRPLRRSLGELAWSTHALLLPHFEDKYRLVPSPPLRSSRSVLSREMPESPS